MGVTGVVSDVVKGLKDSPISLALIAINVVWLAAGGWFLSVMNERSVSRDNLIMQLVKQKDCT